MNVMSQTTDPNLENIVRKMNQGVALRRSILWFWAGFVALITPNGLGVPSTLVPDLVPRSLKVHGTTSQAHKRPRTIVPGKSASRENSPRRPHL